MRIVDERVELKLSHFLFQFRIGTPIFHIISMAWKEKVRASGSKQKDMILCFFEAAENDYYVCKGCHTKIRCRSLKDSGCGNLVSHLEHRHSTFESIILRAIEQGKATIGEIELRDLNSQQINEGKVEIKIFMSMHQILILLLFFMISSDKLRFLD